MLQAAYKAFSMIPRISTRGSFSLSVRHAFIKKGNQYFQLLRGCIRQTIHPLVSQSIDMSVTACHASDEFQYNSAFFGLFQHEAFWDTSSQIYIQFICSPVHPFVMLASLPNISPHTILRLNWKKNSEVENFRYWLVLVGRSARKKEWTNSFVDKNVATCRFECVRSVFWQRDRKPSSWMWQRWSVWWRPHIRIL